MIFVAISRSREEGSLDRIRRRGTRRVQMASAYILRVPEHCCSGFLELGTLSRQWLLSLLSREGRSASRVATNLRESLVATSASPDRAAQTRSSAP